MASLADQQCGNWHVISDFDGRGRQVNELTLYIQLIKNLSHCFIGDHFQVTLTEHLQYIETIFVKW